MAPSGRAYWKGFLRLSLVSIAVEVYNAEERRSEIHFNQIHKPTGKRINYTKTVQGVGPVQTADIVKGYEIDKDDYVVLEPEELDALRLESKRTVDLTQFVSADEIDPRFFEQPYYLSPADEHAVEGYLVIREALRKTKKIGIGQMTLAGREHLVAVAPLEQGLMMERLRYANEIKGSKDFFGDLGKPKLDQEMVELAVELIQRKAGPFAVEKFKDSYATELKKLIEKKAKGERIITAAEPEPAPSNVVNLMDALRKSLKKPGNDSAPTPARKTKAKRRATGK
jgi:DNA end-binding protein Ku